MYTYQYQYRSPKQEVYVLYRLFVLSANLRGVDGVAVREKSEKLPSETKRQRYPRNVHRGNQAPQNFLRLVHVFASGCGTFLERFEDILGHLSEDPAKYIRWNHRYHSVFTNRSDTFANLHRKISKESCANHSRFSIQHPEID